MSKIINDLNKNLKELLDLSEYSKTSHTHNYAGSSSAGGAANSVKTNLIVKLNGGATEETNLFTFNGSTAKTVNITPSSIGAATSSSVGTLSSLQTSAKDNLVAAINELFQNANNGKEIIADAIGEPLNAEDTFAAMGTDINGLLSTFKTNMMNNGVTIESGDKFKSLIDKLTTLSDNKNGQTLQYGQGTGSSETLSVSLNFSPIIIIAECKYHQSSVDAYPDKTQCYYNSIIHENNYSRIGITMGDSFRDQVLTSFNSYNTVNDKTFKFKAYRNASVPTTGTYAWTWFALGIEEDTTLRDSLASILEEEGVEVSDEDNMASLITKVDEEFDRKNANSGLDIISATELPATGKENQICVITDNPVDKFIVTGDFNDITDTGAIYMYTAATDSDNLINGSLVSITSGSITHNYHIIKFCKENLYSTLDSYIYLNGNWEQLTFSKLYFIDNKTMVNTDFFGGIKEASGLNFKWVYTEGEGLTSSILRQMSSCIMTSINNPIDFSKYSTVEVTGYITNTDSCGFGIEKLDEPTASYGAYMSVVSNKKNFSTTLSTYTYDISSWSGTGYLTLIWYTYSYSGSIDHEIFITDFSIY